MVIFTPLCSIDLDKSMLLAANNYILFVLCNGFEYTRTVLVKKVARSEPMGPLVISQPRDLHLGPKL